MRLQVAHNRRVHWQHRLSAHMRKLSSTTRSRRFGGMYLGERPVQTRVSHRNSLYPMLIQIARHVVDRSRVQLHRQVEDVRVIRGGRRWGRRVWYFDVALG